MLILTALAKDPFGPDGFGGGSEHESISECVLKDGKIYVTYDKTITYYWPEGVQTTQRIWKDVYCCSDRVIVLEKQIMANYSPQHTIPQLIEWPTNQ